MEAPGIGAAPAGARAPRPLTGGKTTAPDARQPKTELNALEIDWSQIVRRCMDGDSGAWAELVRTHHRRVYGLCYRFTGNAGRRRGPDPGCFPEGLLEPGQLRHRRGSLAGVDHHHDPQPAGGQLPADPQPARYLFIGRRLGVSERPEAGGPAYGRRTLAARVGGQKELAKMVQNALARVSVELREAVILRDLQDMDYKEIAQVLGIPEGTVKSRISRGRAELARLLERNKREVM
jgi:RNA polymerase sigma-70 factor (ECF subfamily)